MRKWVIGCFLVCPLLCCGGVALFARKWVDTFDYSADLNNQLAEAKKRGMPFVREDMKRSSALPSSENSFPLVVQLIKDFPKMKQSGAVTLSKAPADHEPIPQSLRVLIARAQEIARRKGYESNKDMDKGIFETYPEYLALKNCERALSIKATHEAAAGHADAAIENLRLGRNLAMQLDEEPTLIGVLVRIAMMQFYYRATSKVIGYFENNHELLERLRALLKEPVHEVDRKLFLKGEYYMALSLTRNFKAFGGIKALSGTERPIEISDQQIRRTGLPTGMLERGLLSSFIKHFLEVLTIFEREPNMAISGRKAEEYVDKIPTTTSNAMTQVMMPIWRESGIAWEKQKLSPPMLIASIDLIEHRKDGMFPGEIPEIPDLVGGGTLNYLRTGGGFLIYSSGPNGKDDGGPRNSTTRTKSDDFGYEYPFVNKK